jgi:hypothetical protein
MLTPKRNNYTGCPFTPYQLEKNNKINDRTSPVKGLDVQDLITKNNVVDWPNFTLDAKGKTNVVSWSFSGWLLFFLVHKLWSFSVWLLLFLVVHHSLPHSM